jgi:NDP-mannose synthase
MRAAVLAGGLGTRLRPYTTVLPKPLVPIGDRPILELILDWLARHGVDEVEMCVGHLSELIQAYFSQAGTVPPDVALHWHRETEPLGTAGPLRGLEVDGGPLLVVNGDIVTDLDVSEMLDEHRASGAALTIATRATQVTTELGVIEHHGGVVTGYREKPRFDFDTSMGVYVYGPPALAAIPPGPCQFPDLVLELLARREPVRIFETAASWYHVGSPDQHLEATQGLIRDGRAHGIGPARDEEARA